MSPMVDDVARPRVLVVGAATLDDKTGIGITMSNLFRGWPRESLAQVVTSNASSSESVCRQNYRITAANTPVDHCGRRLFATFEKHGTSLTVSHTGVPERPTANLRANVHRHLRALADL